MQTGPKFLRGMTNVDIVKWIATGVKQVGYGLTGLNMVPWNVCAFFVGMMWKDRAIMVVHLGACVSLLVGFLNA